MIYLNKFDSETGMPYIGAEPEALSDGINDNDILVWDEATQTWLPEAMPEVGSLPSGTEGQTFRINSSSEAEVNGSTIGTGIYNTDTHIHLLTTFTYTSGGGNSA